MNKISAIGQLQPLPIIIICPPSHNTQITKSGWRISEQQLQLQIKSMIGKIQIEDLPLLLEQNTVESQNYQKQASEKRKTILICNKLRLLAELNKHYSDPLLELYISINLGTIYSSLEIERLSLNSYGKALRRIQAEISRYHVLPQTFLGVKPLSNDYISLFEKRYWLHFIEAKIEFKNGIEYSSKMMHKEAMQQIQKSYIDTLKALIELFIVYLCQLYRCVGTLTKIHATIVNKRNLLEKDAEIDTYKFCCSFLYNSIYLQAKQVRGNTQIEKLLETANILINTIKQVIVFDLSQDLDEYKYYLPPELKKVRFLEIIEIPYIAYADIAEKIVDSNPQIVYSVIAFWISQIYGYSIQCLFLEQKQQQKNQAKGQNKPLSTAEHWLAKSLENSSKYLHDTALFHQIKAIYSKNYGNLNDFIEQLPENQQEFNESQPDFQQSKIFTHKKQNKESNGNLFSKNSSQHGVPGSFKSEKKGGLEKNQSGNQDYKVIIIKEQDDKLMFVRKLLNSPIQFKLKHPSKSLKVEIEDPKGRLIKQAKFPPTLIPLPKIQQLPSKKHISQPQPSKPNPLHRSIQTAKQVYMRRVYHRTPNPRKKSQYVKSKTIQVHKNQQRNVKNEKYMNFHFQYENLKNARYGGQTENVDEEFLPRRNSEYKNAREIINEKKSRKLDSLELSSQIYSEELGNF